MINRIKVILVFVGITLLLCEMVLRLWGIQPFKIYPVDIQVHPEIHIEKDSLLGYSSKVGIFEMKFNKKIRSSITHWPDKSRATRSNLFDSLLLNKPKLYIFGCSFTHGHNLTDSMTLAWKIQSNFPNLNVKNYGLGGYGLNQVYLQIKHKIQQQDIPNYLVINYASFHDERNGLSRNWRKRFAPYFNNKILGGVDWPTISYTNQLLVDYKKLEYKEWPFIRYLAIIHCLEQLHNNLIENEKENQRLSIEIIKEIFNWSKQHNFELLVTGIDQTPKTKFVLDQLHSLGINVLDVSIDLTNEIYNFQPLDHHPNHRANTIFAQKIIDYMESKYLLMRMN